MEDYDIDPFEARMEFLQVLEKQSASQQFKDRATAFFISYQGIYEELLECLIDRISAVCSHSKLFAYARSPSYILLWLI